MSTKIEIILCTTCNGTGEIEHSELTDDHKHDYRYWTSPCTRCGGAGRLSQTTTVTIEKLPTYRMEEALKKA